MIKFRIDFNQILQPYTKTDKIYFKLPMDIQQALEYCRYMIQQELNLPAQDIYNGFTIEQVLDYKICPQCEKTFQQNHGNKKYCSDECVKNANKIKNAERSKRYLSNEENHKKHLIRMATDRLQYKGKLVKHNCSICGTDKNIEKHHICYSDQYVSTIVWLCKKHHEQLHKDLGR